MFVVSFCRLTNYRFNHKGDSVSGSNVTCLTHFHASFHSMKTSVLQNFNLSDYQSNHVSIIVNHGRWLDYQGVTLICGQRSNHHYPYLTVLVYSLIYSSDLRVTTSMHKVYSYYRYRTKVTPFVFLLFYNYRVRAHNYGVYFISLLAKQVFNLDSVPIMAD